MAPVIKLARLGRVECNTSTYTYKSYCLSLEFDKNDVTNERFVVHFVFLPLVVYIFRVAQSLFKEITISTCYYHTRLERYVSVIIYLVSIINFFSIFLYKEYQICLGFDSPGFDRPESIQKICNVN